MSKFRAIFDGQTLNGWRPIPRVQPGYGPDGPWPKDKWPEQSPEDKQRIKAHTGRWTVEDGAIVGQQEPAGSGLGAYLLSEEKFGDFELVFEVKPDWPCDTGVYLRATDMGTQAYQVLIDHRKSGNIGGLFGNGIGHFHAINFNLDVERDANGMPIGLCLEDPATTLEPINDLKRSLLTQAASGEEFLKTWRWNDWNEFQITIRGEFPVITTRINGTLIAEADTSLFPAESFNPDFVRNLLGRSGRLALEVHDNDPRVGDERWGHGNATRWRNIRVREF